MSRVLAILLLGCACLGPAGGVHAEGRKVPIARDLERLDRIDDRLARNGVRPIDVEETGSVTSRRAITPYGFGDRLRGGGDPSGVVGFSGPPGFYGDSVGSFSPLPPGSPATLDGRW